MELYKHTVRRLLVGSLTVGDLQAYCQETVGVGDLQNMTRTGWNTGVNSFQSDRRVVSCVMCCLGSNDVGEDSPGASFRSSVLLVQKYLLTACFTGTKVLAYSLDTVYKSTYTSPGARCLSSVSGFRDWSTERDLSYRSVVLSLSVFVLLYQ